MYFFAAIIVSQNLMQQQLNSCICCEKKQRHMKTRINDLLSKQVQLEVHLINVFL